MPELRWTLLILGVLFVAALAWWELRRQRQAPRQGLNPGAPSAPNREAERDSARVAAGGDAGRVHREPTLTFPDARSEPRSDLRVDTSDREPARDPPIVELDETSEMGRRINVELDRAERESASASRAERIERAEPSISGWDETPAEPVGSDAQSSGVSSASLHSASASSSASAASAADADDNDDADADGDAVPEEPVPRSQSHEQSANPHSPTQTAGALAEGEPVVEWPAEELRKIIALRLVSAPADRFPGRSVRLALAAEGFVLGKFDIFHKAGPDSRAVLSAASLTKPGTFAMSTMDAQRFGGLSLFAVLPGPLPARDAFDELLLTARNLNNRLQGALQDERGEPLTPMRSAALRESLGGPSLVEDDDEREGRHPAGDAGAADEARRSGPLP